MPGGGCPDKLNCPVSPLLQEQPSSFNSLLRSDTPHERPRQTFNDWTASLAWGFLPSLVAFLVFSPDALPQTQNICQRFNALNHSGTICDLTSKQITSLSSNDFAGLSNLQRIDLDSNNLSSLPEDAFDRLSNLQEIYLNNNNLSSLPEDIFAGLSNLQDIYLHFNKLSRLPEGIFDGLPKLSRLWLGGNGITCLPRIPESVTDISLFRPNPNLPQCDYTILVLSPSSLPVEEADTATYTVKLGAQPTEAVTVTVSVTASAITVAPASLSFSTSNWNNAQMVTVSAAEDDDISDEKVTLTHTAAGGNYDSMTAKLTVTVRDDDTRDLMLSPLVIDAVKEGGSSTYTVKLGTQQPTATVTVIVDVRGSGVTVNTDSTMNGEQATLSFSTTNWNTAQTVTVNAVEDDDDDEKVTLTHIAAGGNYDSVTAKLAVTVRDDEGPNLCQRFNALIANGAGCNLSNRRIILLSSSDFAGLSSLQALYLDSNDLSSLPEDIFARLSNLKYLYLQYNNLNNLPEGVFSGLSNLKYVYLKGNRLTCLPPIPQRATVIDVNLPQCGSLVLSASPLPVEEAGNATYTVKLAAQPADTATVTVSGMANDVTVAPASLSFSTSNWNTAQVVTVSAAEDDNGTDEKVTLTHTAAAASADYDSVTAELVVTVRDNDPRSLALSASPLPVDEGGTATYTVTLATAPTAAVTVTVGGTGSGVTVDTDSTMNGEQTTLSFSTTDWNTAQTVTVSGDEDDNASDEEVTLTHTAVGADYNSVTAELVVTVRDNDPRSLALSASPLPVDEGGTTTYTVTLATAPTAAVTVTVGVTGSGVTVDTDSTMDGEQTTLSFSTTDWNTAQTVTVSGDEDDNASDEEVTLTHTAVGADYNSVTAELVVTVRDNDPRSLALSASPLPVDEGGSATYTVTLATAPTAAVTVTVGVTGSGVTVDTDSTMDGEQTTLSFSTTNWNTVQIVTVTAEEDDNATGEVVTLSHTASGGDYDSVSQTLKVTVNDNDQKICQHFNALSSNGTVCHIFNQGVISLSSDEFAGLNLKTLYLPGNNLSSLPEDIFTSLSNLRLLWLDHNNLSSLPEDVFAGLSNLEVLFLHHNDLSSLPEDIFDDLSGLHTLFLYHNDLSSLLENIFAGLSNLRDLHLDHNDLSSLPEDIFAGLSNLKYLYLTNNSLSNLSEDVFDGLSKLRTLTLINNNLSSLPENIFDGLSNLQNLYLSSNQLICLPPIPSSVEEIDVTLPQCDYSNHSLVLSPSEVAVDEADTATYTVKLATQPADGVTVTVSGMASGVTVDTDSIMNGEQMTLSFSTSNWDTAQPVTVSADEDDNGSNEKVTLTHTAADGGYGSVRAELMVTVTDNDSSLALSTSIAGGSAIAEGGTARFTLTATPAPQSPLTVEVKVEDSGAFASSDQLGMKTVTIDTTGTATLDVTTDDDGTDEPDGALMATVQAGTGHAPSSAAASASVAVADDDDPPPPVVSITGGSAITEGDTASFTLTATPAPESALTVEVTVADSGAFAASGQLGTKTVTIDTTGTATLDVTTDNDGTDEPDGTLTATVQTGTGYAPSGTHASAAIAVHDNDVATACVSDQLLSTVEGYYEHNQSRPPGYGENWFRVLVAFGVQTADAWTATSRTIVPMTATDAREREANWSGWGPMAEALECLEGVSPTDPEITVTGGSGITEGGDAVFTVSASAAPAANLPVSLTVTDDGTSDFLAQTEEGTRTVTISAGQTSATLTMPTEDDSTDEGDGSVTATVVSATGYQIGSPSSATVAVSDDDDPPVVTPVVSVSGGSAITEGSTASFTLTATPAPQAALTVEVTVEDSGAFAASGESGVQQVTLGTTGTATFDVVTDDDSTDEPDGALTATVQSGTGYAPSGTHASAAIAVHDNDVATACVSDQLLAKVEGYYEHNESRPPGYGENWFRVLVAFGVQTADAWTATSRTMTPMTAADAREREAKWFGWGPMADALECLEGVSSTDPEITVTGGSGITEGDDAVFTVSASPAPAANLTVSLTVTDDGTSDFLAQTEEGTRTVTISAGQTSATLTVATAEDSTDEGEGSVTATVASNTGYQIGSPSSATVAVNDDDDPPVVTPVVSIASGSAITEGSTASFTLTATPAPQAALTVEVTVEDSGAFAASGESGVQQVTLGTTGTATFDVVTENDSTDEPDGALTATVQTGTGYTVAASPAAAASVAVTDDDDPPPPVVSITGGSAISEGGTASFTLTATPAPQAVLTVEVIVEDSGAFAVSGESGVQQVTLGTTGTTTFDVVTENDSTDEPDGALTATVQTGTGYTVAASPAAAASVVVADDDDPPPPVVSIAGGSAISEGGTASFTLTATPAPQAALTVDVTVEDSGAFAASGESGVQQVTLGTTGTATFDVVTEDDSTDEPAGALTATVQVGTGYAPSGTHASAAIAVHDNDVATACVSDQLLSTVEGYYKHNQNRPPGYGENWFRVLVAFGVQTADAWTATSRTMTPMTAADAREQEAKWFGWGPMAEALECLEGASPTDPEITVTGGSGISEGGDAVFTVSASAAPAANLTVSLTVTDDGTSDFLAQTEEGTRTVTILAGQTSATLTVSTEEDSTDEGDGSVTATVGSATGYQIGSPSTATVTVSDDDDPPVATPVVSVSGGSAITEGGTASFTLTAMPAPQSALSVEVTVADSGAFAASGESGAQQVTFGTTGTATFDVVTDDDSTDEPDGTLTATVQAGTGYTVATSPADVASVVVADNDGATAGAPSFSISDATANENSDWRIFFTIRLNRPVEHTVAVTFSTRESNPVSAREGQDYQGLWRDGIQIPFFRGQTEKQIWVPIFNDHHDEDPETFEAVLSNATNGAVIGDGVGVGTITNSDLMPAAWLGRFGRTVSHQVVAALQGRFAANRQTGLNLTLAGEALTSAPPLAENQQVLAKALGFETVTAHQLVEGSSFSFSPEGEAGSAARFAIWGQGALSSFSGQQNSVALDGDVTTALVGAEWSGARWRAGAALSHSWGSGSYTEDNTDTTEDNTGNNAVANGDIATTLTGIFPYGRYGLTPRLAIWAVAGYGWGSLSLKPDGAGTDYSPGTSLTMGAVGMDGLLRDGGAEGLSLTSTADALLVKTTSEAVAGLASSEANISRLRLGLEATRPVPLANGAALLLPSLELGIRHDDGDAETGFGMELAAGLTWTDPGRGISAQLQGRTLLTHADEAFREQSLTVSFAWEPNPTNRGPSLALSHAMGATAAAGMDALLNPTTMEALTAATDSSRQHQFEATLAYGFPAFNGRLTFTPGLGLTLSPDSRTYSLLWALAPYAQQPQADELWQISLEGERQENSNPTPSADHSLALRFSLLF